MHIVIFSVEYPPFICGGVGSFAESLSIGLSRAGFEVTVVSGYPFPSDVNFSIREQNEFGINVKRFPYFNVHPKDLNFQLLNSKKIYNMIKELEPDLIHCQNMSAFPTSSRLKAIAPLVITFHSSPKADKTLGVYSLLRGGSSFDFANSVLSYPVWSTICKRELQDSTKSVAVSKNLRADLLDEMGDEYDHKICSIPNGIDIETLDRNYELVKQDVEENANAILYAGRLIWGKGVLRLIEIAYLLQKRGSSLKIIVHGKGPLASTLQKQIDARGLKNIELKGFASGARLARSMRESKFIILPSYREACPMFLLEGMCLGKIPLVYDLPFAQEFTENGKYGVLAKNAEDLVDQAIQLDENLDFSVNSDEIRRFARNKYAVKQMVKKYVDLYKTLV